MDVLIKGMEMPKNCHNCELSATVNLHYGVGYCCQPLAEMIEKAFERKSNCPLAEVPEQEHGTWKEHIFEDSFWANYCSECNAYLPYGLDWKPNFCPNCGSRME